MKKIFTRFTPLLLALCLSACQLPFFNQKTPAGYVRHCVFLLHAQGLYADSPEWKAKMKEVLADAPKLSSMDDAHTAVMEAAKVAGGKHSFIMAPVTDTSSYQEFAPQARMLEGKIAHVILPAHTGDRISDSLYIHTVFDFLQQHLDAKGVVVDLRGNTGGNMYPMIASVGALLPDGVVISFKSRNRTTPISLQYVLSSYGLSLDKKEKFPSSVPIAVLTDGDTASSGEATLISFLGLDNVRTFGAPPAGYASGNVTHRLSDGYFLAITHSRDKARTGEVYCDDPIQPDVPTDTPMEDALSWILQ